MTNPLPSRILGPAHAGVRFLAVAMLVCLMSRAAAAQDTDDDGVLPVTGSSSTTQVTTDGSSATNGSGADKQLSEASAVIVAGQAQSELSAQSASLEFQTQGAGASPITEGPAESATFLADPPEIAAGESATGSRLQGSGQLNLREGLQVRLMPPQSATKSIAVIVLTQDDSSLASELAGATKPALIIPLGTASPIDLNRFAAVTAKYGALLPGYHATIVFASVSFGDLHVSAVRAETQGGPLEVILH